MLYEVEIYEPCTEEFRRTYIVNARNIWEAGTLGLRLAAKDYKGSYSLAAYEIKEVQATVA